MDRLEGNAGKLYDASGSRMMCVKRLKDNEDTVILPADKGNATVILDRAEYINKVNGLLKHTSTYPQLTRDPTRKVEYELQKLLVEVFHFVPPENKSLYYKLLCRNGSAPALYGLPKIHKPDVPVRPIVDCTRSPLCELSRYLHRVLRPLAGLTATFVKDSSHFIEQLRSVHLEDDEVMVSYDVKKRLLVCSLTMLWNAARNFLKRILLYPSVRLLKFRASAAF